ncbi:unnamed protein product [Eruca vesicaria subsp. sativa]|uniref:Glycine-rich protein n=1 Tax=Eruca vesicaria subsp. sativa TaxID=29727 RepID=A0ABC8K745_ERUVS|nr:unnamed protein product [Eruca vesicaria subsp. sativa]
MGFKKTSLVFYFLFIFQLQHNLLLVSSLPPSVETNHETLPFNASVPDVDAFKVIKTRELAVVIKKGGGGGRGGGSSGGRGGGGGSSSSGGRGGSGGGARIIPRGWAGAMHPAGSHSHRSSGSMNLRGVVSAVGWLCFSVLAGLFLI